MGEEVVKLVCIVPFKLMECKITVEEAASVISDGIGVIIIQLQCYVLHFTAICYSKFKRNEAVDIQKLFDILDDQKFWKELRPLANGFLTPVNISTIKTALYLISTRKLSNSQIDNLFRSFNLADQEKSGKIPLHPDFIFKSLTYASKFLSTKLITVWIAHNLWILSSPESLLPHEYLFLAANAQDRLKLIQHHLSRTEFLHCEKQNGVYKIKGNFNVPDPDARLDKLLSNINDANIKFDFSNPEAVQEVRIAHIKEKPKKNQLDKIIIKAFSKQNLAPNPYRKVTPERSLTRTNSLVRKTAVKTPSKLVSLPRSTTVKKIVGKQTHELQKNDSALGLNVYNDPYHIATLREASLVSYRSQASKITNSAAKLRVISKWNVFTKS